MRSQLLRRLRQPSEPSLSARFIWALLAAVALAALAIAARDFYVFQRDFLIKYPLLISARAVMSSLDAIDNEQEARQLVQSIERITNRLTLELAQSDPLVGTALVQLRDARGQLVYAGGGVDAAALQGVPEQQRVISYGSNTYLSAQTSNARWTLLLAEPTKNDWSVLIRILQTLWPDLLVGFAAVLLPVWLTVRYGLRPLRQLSDHLRMRRADDLSMIDLRSHYTELDQVTASLNGMLERLREHVRREREFVQDAAHELRTPLAVIAAQAHVLTRVTDEVEREEAAKDLLRAIERSSQLAQQLLTLAALDEAPRGTCQTLDVAELVRHTLAAMYSAAAARQLDLSLDAPDRLIGDIDVSVFQSILNNLLENALRYGHWGGKLAVSLSVVKTFGAAAKATATLQLTVADNGPGIAMADRERIFERFVRGANRQTHGSGLGLAIVQQGARTMGGSVSLTDGLDGRGVAFVVRLPC